MRELDIKEIHAVMLDILKKLDAAAEEAGVEYFLAYGSLIGAVRHKGFVPWDDDLDVMLFRQDYEKLIAYLAAHDKEIYPYRLFSRENNADYPHMIARLCDVRYPIEVKNEVPCGMGVFVDIYPLDGMGSGEAALAPVRKQCHRLVDMTFWATRVRFELPKKWYRIPDKFLRYCYAKHKGKEYFHNKLDGLGKRFAFEESRDVGVLIWGSDMMNFDKALFAGTIRMPFEDFSVKAPVGYDAILRKLYGDYMELPPAGERHPKHDYRAFAE